MDSSEVMSIEIDVGEGIKDIEDIGKALKEIKNASQELSKSITSAFTSLNQNLSALQSSLNALTGAANQAAEALKGISLGTATGGLSEEASALGETVGMLFGTTLAAAASMGIEKIISTFVPKLLELLKIGGGTAAAIAAIVVAVAAAIATIATHWDEVSVVFSNITQTLRENSAGIAEAFNLAKGASADMWQSISANWTSYGPSIIQQWEQFKAGLQELWNYISGAIIEPCLSTINEMVDGLWNNHLKPLWDSLTEAIASIGGSVLGLWNNFLKPFIQWLTSIFTPQIGADVLNIIGSISVVIGFVSDIVSSVIKVLDGLIQFVAGVFSGEWEKAWQGVLEIVDGIWSLIKGAFKGIVNIYNKVVDLIVNKILAIIMGAVNLIGGVVKSIGGSFGLSWDVTLPLDLPQTPLLAQGAVLPANRPFLAVVGDQRHGTNVEAPLTTIQEAVAVVLSQQLPALMAGFEAVVNEQRATREMIAQIQIGDDMIANAVHRFDRKMAVMRGL